MKTILQHRSSRRTFLISVAALIVAVSLIRIFVFPLMGPAPLPDGSLPKDPKWLSILDSLFNSLTISLVVSVAIGLFLFYIELPDDEKKLEVVEAFKLSDLFKGERTQTDIWHYTGGLGRHTRTVTIPDLAKSTRVTNQHKTIKIQIIDPENDKTCADYAAYRRGLKSAPNNSSEWTANYVKKECIATIIASALYKNEYPLLDLSICLKNNFSTLRIDLSSKLAIITKEDPGEPALVCREGSFLYRTYKEELLQTFKEYNPIDITIVSPCKISTITSDQAKNIAGELGIGKGLNDEDFMYISSVLKQGKNPYA